MFRVDFNITEYVNGKYSNDYNDNRSVVANDAEHAITKAKKQQERTYKPCIDDEKNQITYGKFEPFNVILLATTSE